MGGHRADAARANELLSRAQADGQQLRRLLDEHKTAKDELAQRLSEAETKGAASAAAARNLEAEKDRAVRDRAAAQAELNSVREALDKESATAQASDSGMKALHARASALTKQLGVKVRRRSLIDVCCDNYEPLAGGLLAFNGNQYLDSPITPTLWLGADCAAIMEAKPLPSCFFCRFAAGLGAASSLLGAHVISVIHCANSTFLIASCNQSSYKLSYGPDCSHHAQSSYKLHIPTHIHYALRPWLP